MLYRISLTLRNIEPYLVFRGGAKTVSAHPLKKEWFVCGSSRGDCILFDIRGRVCNKNTLKPVHEFKGHTRSVSAAFLSPLTGNKLVTVCYDNKIRVFEVGELKTATEFPIAAIKHNNQTGRWLTTFKVSLIQERTRYKDSSSKHPSAYAYPIFYAQKY